MQQPSEGFSSSSDVAPKGLLPGGGGVPNGFVPAADAAPKGLLPFEGSVSRAFFPGAGEVPNGLGPLAGAASKGLFTLVASESESVFVVGGPNGLVPSAEAVSKGFFPVAGGAPKGLVPTAGEASNGFFAAAELLLPPSPNGLPLLNLFGELVLGEDASPVSELGDKEFEPKPPSIDEDPNGAELPTALSGLSLSFLLSSLSAVD